MPKFKIVQQIGETYVTEKGGRNNKFLADDDKTYSTWSKRFIELIGKETEYELTGKEYQGVKEVRLGSGGWKSASKNNDPRAFALGSSARIVASLVLTDSAKASFRGACSVGTIIDTWNKLYEFALAKLSDSPKSGITDEEKEKLSEAVDTFKAEVIDSDQPVDESSIKDRDKTNKQLDIEVQIQDLEKKLVLTDSAKVSFRGACAKTADYCKFLQSMAKGKGIKI